MRDFNFVMASISILSVVLVNVTPAMAQTETTSSDCLGLSVDTEDAPQLNAAISVCTRALGRNDLSPTTRSELLAHRGVAYRNVRDLDGSLADLHAALDLTPGTPRVSRMLAWTYREMGRSAEAEKEYGHALELEPHPQAFLSRCFVRYDMKKLDDALDDCARAHRLDPSEDSTYMTARIHRMLGRSSSAQSLLEAAIGTPMESGRIYGLLAEIYGSDRRPDDARRIRQQGQRKFPKDKDLMSPPKR
ncbi:tetratricopeptide repeat protein [Hyphomicrobium sp. 2TAF46]|uniref:tetratricopeptide repeat protein n=1 Tax=Hyphomicrobium sp. 2TAF46 TaxID=3233019 RepID=UPI003F92625D